MEISRRSLLVTGAAAAALPAPLSRSRAQANTIRIGVMNDQSGPYRDIAGPNGVVMAQVAVQEFGNRGFNIEVLSAITRTSRMWAPTWRGSGSTETAWT